MQKNWFAIFKIKVTEYDCFLLHLLNCWFVCNQTWFDSTASETGVSCEKNRITAFKDKVMAKVQNISECLSG